MTCDMMLLVPRVSPSLVQNYIVCIVKVQGSVCMTFKTTYYYCHKHYLVGVVYDV